ncbi:hypothetical protein NA57DRAFT_59355 [Rhizodiscina lignyota]|uniref:Uncharacterized protein n=1 Tax=Rhizodiscina lignyota TaxID=1504668 RepID=A0A9P4I958_9PEZI|nr:hypothetical protein NA57DRAFT_59355 [Rhizodiscina lignyota]
MDAYKIIDLTNFGSPSESEDSAGPGPEPITTNVSEGIDLATSELSPERQRAIFPAHLNEHEHHGAGLKPEHAYRTNFQDAALDHQYRVDRNNKLNEQKTEAWESICNAVEQYTNLADNELDEDPKTNIWKGVQTAVEQYTNIKHEEVYAGIEDVIDHAILKTLDETRAYDKKEMKKFISETVRSVATEIQAKVDSNAATICSDIERNAKTNVENTARDRGVVKQFIQNTVQYVARNAVNDAISSIGSNFAVAVSSSRASRAQSQAQAAHPQTGHPQIAHPQAAHHQTGYPQAAHGQTAHGQATHGQAAYPQAGQVQEAHAQAFRPQTAHLQAIHPQTSHAQVGQAHTTQAQAGQAQVAHAHAHDQTHPQNTYYHTVHGPVDHPTGTGAPGRLADTLAPFQRRAKSQQIDGDEDVEMGEDQMDVDNKYAGGGRVESGAPPAAGASDHILTFGSRPNKDVNEALWNSYPGNMTDFSEGCKGCRSKREGLENTDILVECGGSCGFIWHQSCVCPPIKESETEISESGRMKHGWQNWWCERYECNASSKTISSDSEHTSPPESRPVLLRNRWLRDDARPFSTYRMDNAGCSSR